MPEPKKGRKRAGGKGKGRHIERKVRGKRTQGSEEVDDRSAEQMSACFRFFGSPFGRNLTLRGEAERGGRELLPNPLLEYFSMIPMLPV